MLTNTANPTKSASPENLDLIPITFKELKQAHYRIAAEDREGRERAGRMFRLTQPGICAYLPYTSSTVRTLAYENALICSFARHFCAAVENRLASAPVLDLEDLLASEVPCKKLLAHRPTAKWIQKLAPVQFAVGGIIGQHYFDGIGVIPDRKRVLLKVLTLWLCFSDGITNLSQPANLPTP